ncbi:nucleoside hydrolase [Simkania sp.]|uniref:nucleoside hydrolase n=1 Tax=Simkania sp. TaxID=34094 RepID=UPI003B525583
MNDRSFNFKVYVHVEPNHSFSSCILTSLSSLFSDLSVKHTEHPFPVIIDTDCDLDDMMAIVYLVKNPRAEVKGVTTVGDGLSRWEYGAQNVLNVLELIGHPRVPVSYGARESLSPVGSYPPNWRQQADALSGIKLPRSSVRPIAEKAPEFIIDIVQKHEEKITLLCIGPLTNIALAFEKKPEIKDKIERIFIMGGALLSPGNIEGRPMGFKNRVSEYNIFLDAKAAQDVFDSGVPITLVPIDVIEHVPTKPFYEMIAENRKTPAANFVYEILKPSVKNKKRTREYLWDPVSAVLLTNPNSAQYRDLKLVVNLRKGPEYGRLIMGSKGMPVRVVTQIDTDAFYDIFLKTLNHPPNMHANHSQAL